MKWHLVAVAAIFIFLPRKAEAKDIYQEGDYCSTYDGVYPGSYAVYNSTVLVGGKPVVTILSTEADTIANCSKDCVLPYPASERLKATGLTRTIGGSVGLEAELWDKCKMSLQITAEQAATSTDTAGWQSGVEIQCGFKWPRKLIHVGEVYTEDVMTKPGIGL